VSLSRNQLVVGLAQGFGLGRIPVAPGTFGTLLGLPCTLLLLATRSLPLYLLGTLTGIVGAVWICGEAEQILGRKDDPSIVLDEIVALPVAFFGWFLVWYQAAGFWPGPGVMVLNFNWIYSLAVFALFRFFDIVKPWPISRTQDLWGGLGVVADDVAAGIAAGIVCFLGMSLLVG
jgi:phosphatidylglycerophosphatase A